MKTKMNLRPIARMSFAAVAFLAASSSLTVKAGETEMQLRLWNVWKQ